MLYGELTMDLDVAIDIADYAMERDLTCQQVLVVPTDTPNDWEIQFPKKKTKVDPPHAV
jgi:hypothetical protein